MNKVKVILTDDHELIRSGLRLLLQEENDIVVVGEASAGLDLLRMAIHLEPDVVLMDIEMPKMNGLEAAEKLLSSLPNVKIILLTMYTEEYYLEKCLEIGCRGYLLKQSDTGEIVEAIRQVHAGEIYFGGGVSRHFMKRSLTKSGLHPDLGKARLSRRETEILCHIAEGASSKEIASKLFISVRTVETHRSNILHKLELSNTAQLVRYAIKHKLVDVG